MVVELKVRLCLTSKLRSFYADGRKNLRYNVHTEGREKHFE